MDQITILRPVGRQLATKRWVLDRKSGKPKKLSYANAKHFNCEIRVVDGIDCLSTLMSELESNPYAFVIRGEPHPDTDISQRVRRMHRPDKNADDKIWFRESDGGQRWVLIDYDKIKVGYPLDLIGDPGGEVEHLVGLLPDEFQDVSYHWQLSSSAGMSDENVLSAHVWFWLDRRVTNAELKAWADSIDAPVDKALFTPSQPHFTATPVFDGVHNPLPRRSGFWRGLSDEVEFPEIETQAITSRVSADSGPLSEVSGFENKLAKLGDGDDLAGFNGPLVASIAAYVYAKGEQRVERDREKLKTRLREAIEAAPMQDGRDNDIDRYSSDDYLDEAIDGAIAQFGHHAAPPMPPHFQHDFVSADKASALIRQHVENLIAAIEGRAPDDPPPQVGVKAPAGSGKTEIVIGVIVEFWHLLIDLNTDVFAPTHALCDEWRGRLEVAARNAGVKVRVKVIRGRGHGAPDDPMCAKWELANEVARMGLPVTSTLCERKKDSDENERCEHHATCRYIAQMRDTLPAVRIWPHEYLFLPRPTGLPEPDLVIIDEQFWPVGIRSTSFGLDRLVTPRNWLIFGQKNMDAVVDLHVVAGQAHDALLKGQPLKATLRELGHDEASLKDAAKTEYGGAEFPTLSPGQSLADQTSVVRKFQRTESLSFYRLWKIIEGEWSLPGDEIHRAVLRHDHPEPGSGEKRDRLFLHWCRDTWAAKYPVLHIDADSDERIVGRFLPHLEMHEVSVERNAHVVQLSNSTVSKTKLLKAPKSADRLADIQALIDLESYIGNQALVVATKGVAAQLTPPANGDLTNFGALRGIDRWKDCNTAMLVGREQPSPLDIEGMMRALFFDRDQPLQFIEPNETGQRTLVKSPRGYRMRDDNSDLSAYVMVHPDPDGQRIIEQIRECGSTQAIDRLRAIYGDLKRIFVLSNIVLDITVDQLTTWTEIMPSRIERALVKHGAVPITATEAARVCPEFWPSANAAKHDFRRAQIKGGQTLNGKGGQTPNSILLRVWPPLIYCSYRRPGQRGQRSRAIVDPRRGQPKQVLEALVGPVTHFVPDSATIHSLSTDPPFALPENAPPPAVIFPLRAVSEKVGAPTGILSGGQSKELYDACMETIEQQGLTRDQVAASLGMTGEELAEVIRRDRALDSDKAEKVWNFVGSRKLGTAVGQQTG